MDIKRYGMKPNSRLDYDKFNEVPLWPSGLDTRVIGGLPETLWDFLVEGPWKKVKSELIQQLSAYKEDKSIGPRENRRLEVFSVPIAFEQLYWYGNSVKSPKNYLDGQTATQSIVTRSVSIFPLLDVAISKQDTLD
ncbi:hypothetical protein KM043_008003 [Ampulex compressa]|nr:hypothetical protein KM043_008003 [Ampulex compressa]